MKKSTLLVLLTLGFLNSFGQQKTWSLDSLDAYIQQGLKDWDIPGLALVIVKEGKTVLIKGYGVRDLTSREPVDANTLFMIASNTKLFTGTALAKLEQEKKLSLDHKISQYFPWYRLYDSLASASVTIRDMLSHRLGTKTFQGDFTFWNSNLSREEIMRRMRLLEPIGLFRQDYGYCNSCFLTAGQVVEKVTGRTWEQYIQDEILAPLEMNRSTAISKGMANLKNAASPYTTSFTGKLNRVPYDEWDNLGPAASIISSVNDLSHWLQFQLDNGRYKGKSIMPFSILQKTRDVNIVTGSRKSSLLPMHFRGYGLGLFAADYNGRQIYWHTGGAAGMVSNVCFVPEEKLGIAILTNNDNQSFFEALRYQLLDHYLGMPYVNRSEQFLAGTRQELKEQLEKIAAWRKRVEESKGSPLPLSAYTGDYSNPIYGRMTITQAGNKLVADLKSHDHLKADLRYMDNGEWLLEYHNIEYGIFSIKFENRDSKVVAVEIRANEFVEYDPYIFRKD